MNEEDSEVDHDEQLDETDREFELDGPEEGGSASAASENDKGGSHDHSNCEDERDRARDDSADPAATGSTTERTCSTWLILAGRAPEPKECEGVESGYKLIIIVFGSTMLQLAPVYVRSDRLQRKKNKGTN